jgi:hypothetical protein
VNQSLQLEERVIGVLSHREFFSGQGKLDLETPMTATNDFERIVNNLTEGMKEQIDNNIPSIRGTTEQENESSVGAENFEFRPLTREEKDEFINSLDARGRQIMADLAGEAKDSNDSGAGAVGRG